MHPPTLVTRFIREEGIANFNKKLAFYEDLIGKEKLLSLITEKPENFLNLIDTSSIVEETDIIKKPKSENSIRLVTEKGLQQIVTLVYKFKDVLPETDFQRVMYSDISFFFNLLADNENNFCYTESLPGIKIESPIKNWSEKNYVSYLDSLALTSIQEAILSGIASKDNISLSNLEKYLQKKGLTVKSGSMVGGSLAGITKKCEAYRIPQLFIIKRVISSNNSKNETCYAIVPSAKEYLAKYLKTHLE